jgi:hypothetical protein
VCPWRSCSAVRCSFSSFLRVADADEDGSHKISLHSGRVSSSPDFRFLARGRGGEDGGVIRSPDPERGFSLLSSIFGQKGEVCSLYFRGRLLRSYDLCEENVVRAGSCWRFVVEEKGESRCCRAMYVSVCMLCLYVAIALSKD